MEFDVSAAIAAAVGRSSRPEKTRQDQPAPPTAVQMKIEHGRRLVALAEREIAGAKGHPERMAFEYTRMAEGYALQGDYEAAWEMTADFTKKREYKEILDALNGTPPPCDCPEKQGKLSTRFVKERIYDATRRQEFDLLCCSLCRKVRI